MNAMRHALLARQLIAACGGLAEAASACRLGRASLSRIQDPRAAQYMPADAIADLEAYCGEPIYSRAMTAARPGQATAETVMAEACDTVAAAAEMLQAARAAASDGEISPAELRLLETAFAKVETQLAEFRSAVEAHAPAGLKAVRS